ncbi:MAG: SDR family oxidoreductase [Candidatus Cloacimonadaceae bacterium]|nr:SDR family oxidoreductase [Candidatus Cloacimonadaceae bacterium]
MRILILGATGLIGHKLWEKLPQRFDDVFCTIRRDKADLTQVGIYDSSRVIDKVDILRFDALEGLLQAINPDVVINCVGITKRKREINDIEYAIRVNSLFPHQLALWVIRNNKRLIHFSTDCVFNGALGNYSEESATTAEDTYGKTKALGELRYPHTLTIRSSFIGRELENGSELLEWFLAQNCTAIKGFQHAMYSGVSTLFMAKVIGDIVEYHPELHGLYQLATDSPISKYDLLCIAKQAFKKKIEIEIENQFININTLVGEKLKAILGYSAPSWIDMMNEIATEKLYDYKEML